MTSHIAHHSECGLQAQLKVLNIISVAQHVQLFEALSDLIHLLPRQTGQGILFDLRQELFDLQ